MTELDRPPGRRGSRPKLSLELKRGWDSLLDTEEERLVAAGAVFVEESALRRGGQATTYGVLRAPGCGPDEALMFGPAVGSGAFGRVCRAVQGGQVLALKTLRLSDPKGPRKHPDQLDKILAEVEMWRRTFPTCQIYVNRTRREVSFTTPQGLDDLKRVSESAPVVALRSFERRAVRLRLAELMVEAARDYRRHHPGGHRDLKPENTILNLSGTGGFLSDFGLATTKARSRSLVGTRQMLAPEVAGCEARGAYSTPLADRWALGLCVAGLLLGGGFRDYLRPEHRGPWMWLMHLDQALGSGDEPSGLEGVFEAVTREIGEAHSATRFVMQTLTLDPRLRRGPGVEFSFCTEQERAFANTFLCDYAQRHPAHRENAELLVFSADARAALDPRS